MSLKLLIDEDSQDKILVNLLKQANHDVVTVNDMDLNGKIDSIVLDFARQENRIIVTQNCDDYEALHEINPEHPGIIAIYNENNPLKNMSFKAIINALANLEAANIPITNQFGSSELSMLNQQLMYGEPPTLAGSLIIRKEVTMIGAITMSQPVTLEDIASPFEM